MLRTAVLLASLGVLLLIGSFFMPRQQVATSGAGLVAAVREKAEGFMKSHFGRSGEQTRPEAIPAVADGPETAQAIAAAGVGIKPTGAGSQDGGTGGTIESVEQEQLTPEPLASTNQDEQSQVEAVHEGDEANLSDQAAQGDSGEEDAESATEVLERIGKKIHGRRG